jgi:hypothetical protein
MSRSMICHFLIDELTTVLADVMHEPPTYFERKATGHYDGLYRIHSIRWNDHADRHEVIYMLEKAND